MKEWMHEWKNWWMNEWIKWINEWIKRLQSRLNSRVRRRCKSESDRVSSSIYRRSICWDTEDLGLKALIERSYLCDIEHRYLLSRKTEYLRRIFFTINKMTPAGVIPLWKCFCNGHSHDGELLLYNFKHKIDGCRPKADTNARNFANNKITNLDVFSCFPLYRYLGGVIKEHTFISITYHLQYLIFLGWPFALTIYCPISEVILTMGVCLWLTCFLFIHVFLFVCTFYGNCHDFFYNLQVWIILIEPFIFYWMHFINPLTAKLINLNFHPLEVVSRWRDPQLQVSENY